MSHKGGGVKGHWGLGKSVVFTNYARNTQPSWGTNVAQTVNSNSYQSKRLLCARGLHTLMPGVLKLYVHLIHPGKAGRQIPLVPISTPFPDLMGGARRVLFIFF